MTCMDEKKCFTTTWKINNFKRYSSLQDSGFRSQIWKTESTEGSALWWRIVLFHDGSNLAFALTRFGQASADDRYEMSLLTSSGEVKLTHEPTNLYTLCYHIEKYKIFGENGYKSFLPQNTLVLYCRIWQPNMNPGQCLLRHVLHEVSIPWTIEVIGFDSKSTKRAIHHRETMVFTTFFYISDTENGTHEVRLELDPSSERWSTFINCKLSIKGEHVKIVSHRSIHPVVNCVFDIIFSPEKCTDGNLHLEFECQFAEEIECPPLQSDYVAGSSINLRGDLLHLYKKTTFSDVTLNTEEKSFSAHKSILASRSEVFHAMFEKDQMKEGRSGVVDIQEIDSATVDRFLVFMYSDYLEDLQFEEASALYYAADKYAVLPLKQKCSNILKDGLSAENVCDLLLLADKHSDEKLMLCAVDFVRDHEEVISSAEWESLETSDSRLAANILRQVILKKVKK